MALLDLFGGVTHHCGLWWTFASDEATKVLTILKELLFLGRTRSVKFIHWIEENHLWWVQWLMVRPQEDLVLLEMLNDWNVSSLRAMAVQEQAAVSDWRRWWVLQSGVPLVPLPLVGEVDRGVPRQGQLRGRAEPQLWGQFALYGSGTLELIVDLHADSTARFLELCWDVGLPLCSMGSNLPHLQGDGARR